MHMANKTNVRQQFRGRLDKCEKRYREGKHAGQSLCIEEYIKLLKQLVELDFPDIDRLLEDHVRRLEGNLDKLGD